MERLRLLFLRGTRRLPLRSRDREDSEPELEPESECEADETDSDSEDDDPESDERLDLRGHVGKETRNRGDGAHLRIFFLVWLSEPLAFCFSLSFSLASKIKLAVPLLDDSERHSSKTELRDTLLFEFLWYFY